MKTLIINIDKDSSLKKLIELARKLHLKISILTDEKKAEQKEREEFLNFSKQNLSKAYSQNEPDYDLSMIKEPNPKYKKRK